MGLQSICEIKEEIKNQNLRYNISFPNNYKKDRQQTWPLIVFLHGASERGNDVNKVIKRGPQKFIEKNNLPFIILSPQCDHGEYWEADKVMYLIDMAIEQHAIDTNRIYLTGMSMGGFGTWQIANHYPDRFAAIVPICGGGSPYMTFALRNMPVWVFHGTKDTIIPISKSEEMVNSLKHEGNEVKFTFYPDSGHDVWTETYNNPELYKWLLKHELNFGEVEKIKDSF